MLYTQETINKTIIMKRFVLIMFAMLTWVIVKVLTKKAHDVSPVMWGVFVIFILRIITLITNFS